jgi:two-component system chemotaxis response regulator CheB
MGTDGTIGAQHIKRAGGKVLVQDESTCVVYGMPKSIADSGYADAILPITRITDGIVETLRTYPQGAKSERSRIHNVKR